MTSYTNVKVNISEGQKQKIQQAVKAGCSAVGIHLGRQDLKGNDIIAITNSQAKKLAKAYKDGKGITIKMKPNNSNIIQNTKLEGGLYEYSQRIILYKAHFRPTMTQKFKIVFFSEKLHESSD